MNEIVVIRRTAEENLAAFDAIRSVFPEVIDIHQWRQVRFDRLDSNGQLTVYLGTKPIDDVRVIVPFGMPYPYGAQSKPTRDQTYVQMEREQALLAAIASLRQVRVLNRAIALAWNRGTLEPPGQLRILAKIGWRTPTVTQSFELGGEGVGKIREPDPSPEQQDLLVLGLRRHARRRKEPVDGLDTMIARTQLAMRELGIDLCTIPFAAGEEGLTAFGLSPHLPAELPRDELAAVLREAIL